MLNLYLERVYGIRTAEGVGEPRSVPRIGEPAEGGDVENRGFSKSELLYSDSRCSIPPFPQCAGESEIEASHSRLRRVGHFAVAKVAKALGVPMEELVK